MRRLTLSTNTQQPPAPTPKATKPTRATVEITPVEEAVLLAVYTYHYLTVEQLVRLRYSQGATTYARDLCKRVADKGYLQRLYLPHTLRAGQPKLIYTLARNGLNYLREEGYDVRHRFRAAEEREKSYATLKHTLAVNDFLIAAHLLPRHLGTIRVAGMRHERDLRREDPPKVEIRVGEGRSEKATYRVVTDGWLDLRLGEKEQVCLVLELDRGTREQKSFRQKVAALVAYAKGPYKAQFGTESITIAFAVASERSREKRAEDIVRWIEQELTALGEQHEADLFRVAALPETLDPPTVFLAPCWRRPFDTSLLPLLGV